MYLKIKFCNIQNSPLISGATLTARPSGELQVTVIVRLNKKRKKHICKYYIVPCYWALRNVQVSKNIVIYFQNMFTRKYVFSIRNFNGALICRLLLKATVLLVILKFWQSSILYLMTHFTPQIITNIILGNVQQNTTQFT